MDEQGKRKPSEHPFVVITDTGGIHSGYVDETEAQARVNIANAAAEEMGLKTRYSIRTTE